MSTRVVIEEIAATDREVIQVEGERVTRGAGNSLAQLIRQIGGYEESSFNRRPERAFPSLSREMARPGSREHLARRLLPHRTTRHRCGRD